MFLVKARAQGLFYRMRNGITINNVGLVCRTDGKKKPYARYVTDTGRVGNAMQQTRKESDMLKYIDMLTDADLFALAPDFWNDEEILPLDNDLDLCEGLPDDELLIPGVS